MNRVKKGNRITGEKRVSIPNRKIERHRGSISIPGEIFGKEKQNQDVAFTHSSNGVHITAAIDGIGSEDGGEEGALLWKRVLIDACSNLEPHTFTPEAITDAVKEVVESSSEDLRDVLEKAVFSAVFSKMDKEKWKHIAIWNGDGGVVLFLPEPSFLEIEVGISKLPLDLVKHLNIGSVVYPNRILNESVELNEINFSTFLGKRRVAFHKVFFGEGRVLAYTDGVIDAFFGLLRAKGKEPKSMSADKLNKNWVRFFKAVSKSISSDKEKLKDFLIKYAQKDNYRDDISIAFMDF